VLQLYREVNLIYSFSEKLAALLDLDRVAHLTLQEARHLIVATDGAILLLDEETGMLTPVAVFGDEFPRLPGLARGTASSVRWWPAAVAKSVNDGWTRRSRRDPSTAIPPCGRPAVAVAWRRSRSASGSSGAVALGAALPMGLNGGQELKLLTTAVAAGRAGDFEECPAASNGPDSRARALERERLLDAAPSRPRGRAGQGSNASWTLAARIQPNLCFPP
jgi:hypothetical protein